MKTRDEKNDGVDRRLEARAREIEAWAEERFIDRDGVVYTAISKETGRPLDSAFFAGAESSAHCVDVAPEAFWSYENCGMTTGAYLQAMTFRYWVEKDAAALVRARRCFDALSHIYELGKKCEEGFFPKIYGGEFFPQTSSDQTLYCVMALDQYRPLADDETKKRIDHMIAEMVRFWIRHHYKFVYYDRGEIDWPLVRFPSLALLAYKRSGDTAFEREYRRLLELGVTEGPEFAWLNFKKTGKRPTSPLEEKIGAWLINETPDLFAMDVMQLDYKLRNDPRNERCPTWKNSMALMWEEAKIMLAPDGKAYFCVLVDIRTGKACRLSERLAESDVPPGYKGLTEAKWGRSTITARTAAQAAYFFPENREMIDTAKHILSTRETKDLIDMEDVAADNVRYHDRTRFLCGDTMANWLWGYWQGRYQGLW